MIPATDDDWTAPPMAEPQRPRAATVAGVTRYEIRDAAGDLVAIHERIDGPDGKRFIWRQPDGTVGLGGYPLAELPLFGIHLLDHHSAAVIAEGERAAQSLIDRGINAVGTVTGAASTPGRVALAELTGRTVVIWADNDDVGKAHMERIADALVGIAAGVLWLDWREAPPHGDAADYPGNPQRLIDEALHSPVHEALMTVAAITFLFGPEWARELPDTARRLGQVVHLDILKAEHDPVALAAALDRHYPEGGPA